MENLKTEKEETKELLRQYRHLLRSAKGVLREGDTKVIKKAFNTAAEAHRDVRRKSGEPYIFHPLAVAQICVEEIGLGTTSIVAALLHDVVEDTEITLGDIEKTFGRKVAKIIDGLTKISGATKDPDSKQAENFKKIILTLSDDVRVILIKLADRLHNMRTLGSMPKQKQLKISSETIYLFAPVAHRLGLYTIKTELEELYLKYTEPESFLEIKAKLAENATERLTFIREFISPVQKELRKNFFEFTIKGRPKSVYSIWKKMKKQNVSFEEVFDLFAIRIILNIPEDKEKSACWQVYSIVTDHYRPNPDRLRDWISTPKANGYESLHTTVMSQSGKWVEVQIRSERMDDIAEKGYAAHWKYKNDRTKNESYGLDLWIEKVRDMFNYKESNAKEFVDDFRTNLFTEEIFTFTPKGDLKIFPRGATVLDFAYEVHSEFGTHCLGGKINHQLVPINHELQSGDQIEILTSKSQSPADEWLKVAVTSRARKHIKDFLNDKKRQTEKRGKELLTQKLLNFDIELNSAVENRLTNLFQVHSPRQVYYKIGTKQIDLNKINKPEDLRRVVPRRKILNQIDQSDQTVDKVKKLQGNTLIVGDDSVKEIAYHLSDCCAPIPGDDILGFVTVNEGVKIHRSNCPLTRDLLTNYGHRIIKSSWSKQLTQQFQTRLKVVGTDRKGMLNDITDVLYKNNDINIVSLNASTNQNIFDVYIVLSINSSKHLEELLNKINKIADVLSAERVEPQEQY